MWTLLKFQNTGLSNIAFHAVIAGPNTTLIAFGGLTKDSMLNLKVSDQVSNAVHRAL